MLLPISQDIRSVATVSLAISQDIRSVATVSVSRDLISPICICNPHTPHLSF